MKKAAFAILAGISIPLFSCNSLGGVHEPATTNADSQSVAITPAYDASLVRGKVTDTVICRNDSNQGYALFLPASYTVEKSYPCIYFFDAHARGAMPVSAYKNMAEKYGFVLVGSNVSKNGMPWPKNNEGIKVLMRDTRTRINIDPKRIYTAGFSGGSRVAGSVAIYDGGVAGVIGCAAGFPALEQEIQNKFDYFGIVGDYDFNLTEMAQLDETLEQTGFQHQLLVTGSIHGWASPADFETGLLWMQANAMKEHRQVKNDTVVRALKKDMDSRVGGETSTGDWINVYRLSNGAAKVLDGLTDVSGYKKQAATISAGAPYKSAVTMQAQLQQEEIKGQQELEREFAVQNEKWWTDKIAELNGNASTAKTRQQSQMNKRLVNYLGFVGYMYTDHALRAGDFENAANYLKIFKMADPKNPDCNYLAAVYYMGKGNSPQALSALNQAAASGYSETSKLIADPAFEGLHGDAGFKRVVSRVRENVRNK